MSMIKRILSEDQRTTVFRPLFSIFLLALVLRLVWLGNLPSGFHNDEVDVGYVGKFILLNGHDPAGNFLPLTFNKFGDFRPAGLFYIAGLSELIFGTNVFAARLPTALFGALSIWPIFYLANELFILRASQVKLDESRSLTSKRKFSIKSNNINSNRVAYSAAFFLAILPWHIVLSRAGHEAIIGYFFVLWGLYFVLKFLRTTGQNHFIWAGLFLFFSYFFYHGIRILVPILILGMLIVLRTKPLIKLFIIFAVLTSAVVLTSTGGGRFSQLVFYKNPGTVKKIQELPYADVGNIWQARVFHNKPVVYTRELLNGYAQYFSPDFLFFKGGYPERYAVPEAGLMFLAMVPFLIIGLIYISRMKGVGVLPIIWLLAAPLIAVATYEDIPSVTRASFMIFPLVMIGGWGFSKAVYAFGKLGRLVILVLFGAIVFGEIVFFSHEYMNHQRFYKGVFRDEGMVQEVEYINSAKDKYDLVLVPYGGNFPFYFLFYNNIFDSDIKIDLSDLSQEFRRGNVVFTRDFCNSHRFDQYKNQKVLFINEENCEEKQGNKRIYELKRSDGTVVFRAYEQVGN